VVTGVLLIAVVSAEVIKGVVTSVEVVSRVLLTREGDNGVLPTVGGWTIVLLTSKVVDELASTVVPTGVVVATVVDEDKSQVKMDQTSQCTTLKFEHTGGKHKGSISTWMA
jgi:hypothetical protein